MISHPVWTAALLCCTLASPVLAIDAAERSLRSIDWDAVRSTADQLTSNQDPVLAAFAANQPQGLTMMALPVLIFGQQTELPPPMFVGQHNAYVAFYQMEEIQISILGSNSVLTAGDELKIHHETGAFESIGDGADYSFAQFGAFYTLRITCDQPTEDSRCTKPAYLTEVAKTLIPVVGANQ